MKVRPLRLIATDRAPGGWEELWSRDQWRGRELPHGDLAGRSSQRVILHFKGLAQPWLKEAAKRWVRARVLASTTPVTMSRYLNDLAAFSRWLAERAPEVRSPAQLTRELIEDYLLAVRTSELAGGTKWARIGALRSLLAEQREDGLAGLPPTTNITWARRHGRTTGCRRDRSGRVRSSSTLRTFRRCPTTSIAR